MTDTPSKYPGEHLGLPEAGVGSIGRIPRRLLALLIDYAAAYAIAASFFPPLVREPGVEPIPFVDTDPKYVMLMFVVEQILLIPFLAGSPGHRIVGMKLVRADGAWTGFWRPIVRSLLLAIVVPAVIWDADQRGLHDKAAGTMLIVDRGPRPE